MYFIFLFGPLLTFIAMVIAVNTRLLLKNNLEGIGYFEQEVFSRITRNHPEHEFIFFFDRPFDRSFLFSENVKGIVLYPPTRHPLLWKLWFDIKIPLQLRKLKADVFVSPEGMCSLTTSVPQCIIAHDLGFLHRPDAYKTTHRQFNKYYTPKFFRKAKTICTVSEFSKQDIIKQYNIDPDKIPVVYSAAKPSFQPVDEETKTSIKEKYTGGKEYFIYAGAIQPRKNLLNLLKGFSLFKKRQKSDWKLVLAGRLAWKNEEFLQLFRTYKYKEDVVLTGYVPEDELVKLVGSAYALIYPSFFEGFGVPVLEGMKCNVPVLTSQGTSMQEIAADAALYFDPYDATSIGNQVMHIYKDESLRSRLIEKGRLRANEYSWDKTADLVWKAIEDTLSR